jgi:hypothetical protein
MTGRGAGYCAGAGVAGSASLIPGRGRGMGLGRGFGRGVCRGLGWIGVLAAGGLLARTLFGSASRADEKALLTEQARNMEGALANIKQRLSELDKDE